MESAMNTMERKSRNFDFKNFILRKLCICVKGESHQLLETKAKMELKRQALMNQMKSIFGGDWVLEFDPTPQELDDIMVEHTGSQPGSLYELMYDDDGYFNHLIEHVLVETVGSNGEMKEKFIALTPNKRFIFRIDERAEPSNGHWQPASFENGDLVFRTKASNSRCNVNRFGDDIPELLEERKMAQEGPSDIVKM